MKAYCIYTDHDKYYYLIKKDNNMCIIQTDRYRKEGMEGVSGQWRLIGFHEIRPFNHLGPTINVEGLLQKTIDNPYNTLCFKNGKGKYILVDYDHGTIREWGDRINSIWELEL